ncbi:hypothetical protein KAU11_00560 [Candidatus Babeliales bacterium]|nr:hypothetical protein [Candidatus Babeliales bacterium]
MNWEMVGAISGLFVFFGVILIAAAKSIFTTKVEHHELDKELHELDKELNSKLYDDKSLPIFVTRIEWDKSKVERERRQDVNQRAVCKRMNEMKESIEAMCKAQNKTNVTIGTLLGRVELCIEQTIGLK